MDIIFDNGSVKVIGVYIEKQRAQHRALGYPTVYGMTNRLFSINRLLSLKYDKKKLLAWSLIP